MKSPNLYTVICYWQWDGTRWVLGDSFLVDDDQRTASGGRVHWELWIGQTKSLAIPWTGRAVTTFGFPWGVGLLGISLPSQPTGLTPHVGHELTFTEKWWSCIDGGDRMVAETAEKAKKLLLGQ